ncbi:hypothetical protein [Dysosmobacter welbionis]|uniref:hypothetical protein n=1 Tax=Dysosmobacter welbionis TaxID=2093857 RepID=UPI003994BC0C
MKNFKGTLQGLFGGFGIVLYYLVSLIMCIMPLTALNFPVWSALLFIIITQVFPVIGGFAWIVVWGWSFIVMLHAPFCAYTIAYFVCFLLYLLFFFIPFLLRLFSPSKE